jgi:uncharacterized membrane protein
MDRKEERVAAAAGQQGDPPADVRKDSFWRRMRRYFLTGIIVLLPAVISAFVLWRLFTGLDLILGRYVELYLGRRIPGIGVVALILIIVGTGALASNILGKRLIRAWEFIVGRIPLMRWIYRTTKQLFSTFLEEKNTSFGKVVLVNFPCKGTYSMAFQTSESAGIVESAVGKRLVTVFLPTTPNPTSGYFLLVPHDEVVPLDISVDEGLKYIISAGAIARVEDFEDGS